jgi:hypothetical protein
MMLNNLFIKITKFMKKKYTYVIYSGFGPAQHGRGHRSEMTHLKTTEHTQLEHGTCFI